MVNEKIGFVFTFKVYSLLEIQIKLRDILAIIKKIWSGMLKYFYLLITKI